MTSPEAAAGRRLLVLAGAAALVVATEVAWLALGIGGATVMSNLVGVASSGSAAVACFWAATRSEARTRRAWLALGAGCGSWMLGQGVWAHHELILGDEVPFPGWSDVGFLALIPCAVLALMCLPTAPARRAARSRALLDALVIALSVLFVGWAAVIGEMIRDASGSLLYDAVSLAYPAGDLALIAVVLIVFTRAQTRERTALSMLGAGLLSIAIADFGFFWLNLQGLYSTGSLVDPLWDAGFFLIAIAAAGRPGFTASPLDDRRMGAWSIATPYAPFLLVVIVAGVVQGTRGGLEAFLVWNGFALVVILAVRQILALSDNLTLNRDLELRVAERTRELSRALAEVEESKRLQEEFVANTSHELLTPLTVIQASLEMLAFPEEGLDASALERVEMAQRASIRMKRLVEDVLLASGFTTNIDSLNEPFDVRTEIELALSTVGCRGKTVEVEADAPLVAVGDAERFRTVLAHLLTNADKFCPPNATIRITASRADDVVHVIVADDGPGIPADQRKTVFKRFYQIDGSATRRHGGIGLGLFLARYLLVSMGGGLDIDDTASGASLHCVLPAAAVEREQGRELGGMVFVPVSPAAHRRGAA